jgi:hypothetical protein|tara:strand:- start:3771 stop:4433 length:663 start_codon:yes stop_codon:yes gene_type:complete
MAVNKNFVVKNGIEVSSGLLFADNGQVGVGTTATSATLEVKGNIHAEDIRASGVSTAIQKLHVGTSGTTLVVDGDAGVVGFNTTVPAFLLDVRSSVSTGQTALYLQGNAVITGSIDNTASSGSVDTQTLNVIGTGATVTSLNVTGVVTATSFVGNGSNITGFPAGSVGVSSGGTIIGTGATVINFAGTNAVITATPTSSGISTITIQPSVSLGLVIALGA